MSTDVNPVNLTSVVPSQPALTDEWDRLTVGADAIEGFDLQKDKSVLIGVPFLITGITVRPGIKRNKQPTNYVSAECVVAPARIIAQRVSSGRITAAAAGRVTPLERIVMNDGSTGFCRQITAYLAAGGYITLPDGPDGGAAGESRFDTFYEEWTINHGGTLLDNGHVHFTVKLRCDRGLRVSEYENEAGESNTYYLA